MYMYVGAYARIQPVTISASIPASASFSRVVVTRRKPRPLILSQSLGGRQCSRPAPADDAHKAFRIRFVARHLLRQLGH